MKRAKNLFERAGFEVFEFPVDFKQKCLKTKPKYSVMCFIPNADNLSVSSLALREILGRIIYKSN